LDGLELRLFKLEEMLTGMLGLLGKLTKPEERESESMRKIEE